MSEGFMKFGTTIKPGEVTNKHLAEEARAKVATTEDTISDKVKRCNWKACSKTCMLMAKQCENSHKNKKEVGNIMIL